MARRRYRQSRQNAIIQWTIPLVILILVVIIQSRLEREIGWIVILLVLGFTIWFGVLYEKSREEDEPEELGSPADSETGRARGEQTGEAKTARDDQGESA